MYINSSRIILLGLVLVCFGFIWKTFMPTAPYTEYALAIEGLAGITVTKRLLQKQEKYGCTKAGEGGEDV